MSYVSENRTWLEPYVRQLADAMGLPHWRIVLKDGWPDEAGTGDMCVWRNNNYYSADLYIRDEDITPEDLRSNIAHEMVHLLTRDYDQVLSSIEDQLPPTAWEVLSARMHHEMEQVVDAIAYAWAATLPLPVVPDGETEAAA